MSAEEHYDVVIVGGGPGGSTAGTFLKKYNPALKVAILEKSRFPREHVGESQLPAIGAILDEMGVWNDIEAANFVIKLGATYTWGKTTDPWVFSFIPLEEIGDTRRPVPFGGWRKRVALQVDRAKYDQILLKHAAKLGCDVFEETSVVKVLRDGDRITGLNTNTGRTLTAKYYIDASGNVGVLREALGVRIECPTLLQNVAFWDYWKKPGLNNQLLEKRTIRVQIRSVPFGWIWYIALSDDETSVGLVCPAKYFKESGKTGAELYAEALSLEPAIKTLLEDAASSGNVRATKDWSFLADRAYGENWFLCGESMGFADPILAAGLTLTHSGAQHCAFTILEIERAEHDKDWLLSQYDAIQRKRIRQHMKFADYWYSANGCFSDLQEHCSRIAENSGLNLSPEEAFRWLSNGGIDDHIGQVDIGGFNLASIKQVQHRLSHSSDGKVGYRIDGKNVFKLREDGAKETHVAHVWQGRVTPVKALERDGDVLVLAGGYEVVYNALKQARNINELMPLLRSSISKLGQPGEEKFLFQAAMQCLESMVSRGWVKTSVNHKLPLLRMETPEEGEYIFTAPGDGLKTHEDN
ncbi:MAG: tryptophan 7-halogenase [Planctomycetes bacterium]|nr:tryptophan 7-halogenase [Planctomycetota bacterium]